MEKIDVVITWVDGNDPEWKKEKEYYLRKSGRIEDIASLHERYRNWDNLQYIFRGIEKFMPWVNKVHFVTWGHLPSWLNVNNRKLNIVRHTDFIPEQYLPTFNSNTIELNLHRISGLAEKFINFNDDMFVIRPTKPEDFFQNGKPCDMACISPQPIQRSAIANIELNNLKIINDHFTRENILKNKWKWLNPFLYGQYAIRTAIFLQFSTIIGIFQPHIPFSYIKSTIDFIWEEETEILDLTCKNRFRTVEDVNEWLFRSWQLLSGNFVPRSKKIGLLMTVSDVPKLQKILKSKKYKLVCINDGVLITDFKKTKTLVNTELNKILPDKCTFEI